MSNTKNIGTRGQKAFSLLCSDAGLICNDSSLEDATGWDFFVQFPLDTEFDGPFDQRPAALCAFFQVKTSQSKFNLVEVRLSNAERMAREVKPTFFALVREDKKTKKYEYCLAHIGRNAIAFILRELRQASALKIEKTNRKRLYIPVSVLEIDLISDPVDIVKIIRKYCGSGLECYISSKQEILKSVGFENESFTGVFSVSDVSGDNKIVSLIIGEIEELSVSDVKITETRFGIAFEKCAFADAKLSVEPAEIFEATVVFENEKLGLRAEFVCGVKSPSVPNISDKDFRVRLFNHMFAFSVGPVSGITGWNFTPNNDAHKSWHLLREDCIFLKILATGGSDFSCFKDGKRFAWGNVDTKGNYIHDIEEFRNAIHAADNLNKYHEVRFKFLLSINQFFSFMQRNRAMNCIVGAADISQLLISHEIAYNAPKKFNEYKAIRYVFPMLFPCNNGIMSIPIIIEGTVSANNEEVTFYPKKFFPGGCEILEEFPECIQFFRNFTSIYVKDVADDVLIIFHDSMMSAS